MTDFRFEPKDFDNMLFNDKGMYLASKLAQDKLDEWLSSAQVVYGTDGVAGWSAIFRGTIRIHTNGEREEITAPTHKALLIKIEPIIKCEHRPTLSGKYGDAYEEAWDIKCEECGAKLKPTGFEEVK